MKSTGLAMTIFALTATLVALDLSGAHHGSGSPFSAQARAQKTNASSASIASSESTDSNENAADDDEDEGDGELVKTFLVTPRQLPAANHSAPVLRYD